MKNFDFIVLNQYGQRGLLTVKDICQKFAVNEAKKRAKRLHLTLIF